MPFCVFVLCVCVQEKKHSEGLEDRGHALMSFWMSVIGSLPFRSELPAEGKSCEKMKQCVIDVSFCIWFVLWWQVFVIAARVWEKGLWGAQGQDNCLCFDLQPLGLRAAWYHQSIAAQTHQRPDYKAIWLALIEVCISRRFPGTSYQNWSPCCALMVSFLNMCNWVRI